MKKILSLLLAISLATPAFASVGIKTNGGATLGTATDLSLPCDPNSTITSDGSSYNVGCNTGFVMAGIANGGSTSMATATLAVPVTFSLVRKAIAALAAGSFSAGTMANGVPGQQVTFQITAVGSSGTYTITPTTATGWTTITFTVVGQYATFLYVNNTIGWVILATGNVSSSTLPTITDVAGQ